MQIQNFAKCVAIVQGQFHKNFNASIFYWCKLYVKIYFGVKTPVFGNKYWATCCQFKHFCSPFWHFESQILFMKMNFENAIIFWHCYFGILSYKFWRFGFMKSTPVLHNSTRINVKTCIAVWLDELKQRDLLMEMVNFWPVNSKIVFYFSL